MSDKSSVSGDCNVTKPMTNQVPRSERYYATIEFCSGFSADCKSGNLKRLLARIKNNFAGEVTSWGFKGGLPIVAYEVVDRWDANPYMRCIVASREIVVNMY